MYLGDPTHSIITTFRTFAPSIPSSFSEARKRTQRKWQKENTKNEIKKMKSKNKTSDRKKINNNKSWFFKKIKKMDKSLVRII